MHALAFHHRIIMPDVHPSHIAVVGTPIPTAIDTTLRQHYHVTVLEDIAPLYTQTATHFDLIFLFTPHLEGTLEALRQHPRTAQLPVLLLLPEVSKEVIQVLGRFTCVDFIVPFVVQEVLLARIELLLAHSKNLYATTDQETMRSELLRVAAHNLKSPLNTLKLVEDTLRERHADEESRFALDTLRATVKNMQAIIDDFMDMVVIQTGNLRLKLQTVELFEVIMNVIAQYQLVADSKSIRLSYGKTGGQVMGDSRRVLQIVSNLVSNALKFSPSGTHVRLWTQHNGQYLRLCVADEGPGVRPEERHLLFQEFSRISTRPTGSESSTGLGLWIVKQLAQEMGGSVSAGFPPGGGAIFYVDLPFARDE